MHREPVNPDDPQLTAYALGELSAAETAAFEARLEDSPEARSELESMSEVMDLLSDGLRAEWRGEGDQPQLEVLPPAEPAAAPERVVAGNFRASRRVAVAAVSVSAAAAVVLALAVAGGFAVVSQQGGEVTVADWGGASESAEMAASVDPSAGEVDPAVLAEAAPAVHVPRLFLAEEVEDVSELDLAHDWEVKAGAASGVDASYLDSSGLAPVSAGPQSGGAAPGRVVPAGFREDASDRVDSYLPPLGASGAQRPDVSGGSAAVRKREGVPGGSSGEPVVTVGSAGGTDASREGEVDLRLLADFQQIQRELDGVLGELPEGSAERRELRRVLERNRRAVAALKREFSR